MAGNGGRRSASDTLRLIDERARVFRAETGREIGDPHSFGQVMGELVGIAAAPEVNAAYARTWFEQWRFERGPSVADARPGA